MPEILIGLRRDDGRSPDAWSDGTDVPGLGRIRPLDPLGFDGADVLLFAFNFTASVGAGVLANWITQRLREKGFSTAFIGRREVELAAEKVEERIVEELKSAADEPVPAADHLPLARADSPALTPADSTPP